MGAIWTADQEAARLAKRFADVNQAKFASKNNVPGGASMVTQHIKGHRPISLEAAMAYARGFGVPLEDISPRLAKTALECAALVGDRPSVAHPADSLADALEITGAALAATPKEMREAVALNMAGWAREGGAGHWRSALQALLAAGKQTGTHG